MSSNLRKCISLGVDHFLTPGGNYSYLDPGGKNRFWVSDTNTRWVRFWVDWAGLEQTRGQMDLNRLGGLDSQIRQARRDGRNVILAVNYRFPQWVNQNPNPNYLPVDVGRDSPWWGFIKLLYERYKPFYPHPDAGEAIQVLEIMNEPNLKGRPLTGLADKVIEMFRSAQSISAEFFDHQLHIGGPALSDRMTATTPDEAGDYIPFEMFIDQMRAAAAARGYTAADNFIWTHHNYGDVEKGSDSTRAARARITPWWTGYDEGNGPVVFATEGGARLGVIGNQEALQSALVTTTFDDLKTADRIAMHTNYLTCDPAENNYSGFRGAPPTTPARQLYAGWKGLSTGSTDLSKWRSGAYLNPWTQWDPGILSQRPGHLEVFCVGGNLQAYNTWSVDNGRNWSAWNPLGGRCSSAPGVISIVNGTMDMFVVGDNNELFHKWWSASGGWSAWTSRGGSCKFDTAVGSFNSQHIQIFTRWTDGTLWHRWWWVSGGWSQWHQLWGGQLAGGPSAVSWADGRMDVVFRGTDNAVHHMYYDGGWHGPNSLGGWTPGNPEIVSWKPGHLDVIAPGGGSKLWRKTFDRVWSNWDPIPHTYGHQFSPGAVSPEQGRIDVAYQKDNRIKHVYYSANAN